MERDYRLDILSRIVRICQDANDTNRSIHLGIFIEPFLSKIISGEKKYEARFSTNDIVPHGRCNASDIVITKKSGGKVLGYFYIGDVLSKENCTPEDILEIRKEYAVRLCADSDDFWNKKKNSRFFTMMRVDNFTDIEPFDVNRVGMSGWEILRHPKRVTMTEL